MEEEEEGEEKMRSKRSGVGVGVGQHGGRQVCIKRVKSVRSLPSERDEGVAGGKDSRGVATHRTPG